MFSINLKEVTSGVELPDKVFTDESRYELTRTVREHIMTNHPGVFSNPVTANRKIEDAIRDDIGLTNTETFQKKDAEFDEWQAEKTRKEDEIIKVINEKYAKIEEERDKQHSEKLAELSNEKSEAETDEEKEQVQIKIDDHIYQGGEKMKEVWDKRTAETEKALALL
jgi:hypothetical protein